MSLVESLYDKFVKWVQPNAKYICIVQKKSAIKS